MINPEFGDISSGTSTSTVLWCLPLYMALARSNKRRMVRGIALIEVSGARFKRVGWFYGDEDLCYSESLPTRDVLII